MKKIVFIFIMYICLIIMGCRMKDYKYPVGKDSFVVVGDGRFQILSGPTDYALYDQTKDDPLIETIISYYDNGENKLYVRGKQKYVIANYDNNTYDKYNKKNLDKMPQKELEVFQSDKMREVPEIETFVNNNGVSYIYD